MNKAIEVGKEIISAAYKETALKAANDVPSHLSADEQSDYIYKRMTLAHPEISWACTGEQDSNGEWEKAAYMWYPA